jgi:hypothetical protein
MARTDHRNRRGPRRTRKVYGAAKRLEMARSVLPSTLNVADEMAAVRRTNRRAVARDLRRYRGAAGDAVDRFDADGVDVTRYPCDEIKRVVGDRREADKLGPFQRWAVEITRHLPIEERLDAVRGVMPNNLIGRHALSHVRFLREFEWMDHDGGGWRRDDDADEAAERERVVVAVRAAIADGRHGELNATMRANAGALWKAEDASLAWQPRGEDCWFRPLGGAWDVEAFVDDILDNRHRCRGQAIALRRFTGEIR